MNILIALFFLSLCAGQLGAIQVQPNVYVYLHDFVAAILVVFTAIQCIRKKKIQTGKLLLPLGVFTAGAFISLLVNVGKLPWPDVFSGSLYLVRYILYATLYIAVLNLSTQKYWVKMMFLFGCVFAGLGLLQFFLYPQLANLTYLGWDPHYYRLFSTILDPNYASLLIGLTIILGTVYWSEWPLWVTISINGVLLSSLILTYSRSGFLSFIVSGIMYMFLTKRYKMLILFGAFVALFILIPRSPLDVTSMFRKTSSIARIENAQTSWELVKKSPVIGFGFNTIRSLRLKSTTGGTEFIVSRAGAGIDNSFLYLLATVGFIGTAVYCWLLYIMMKISIRVMNKKPEGRAVAIVFLSILPAIAVHSMFNNSLFYAWILLWVWILAGTVERYLR